MKKAERDEQGRLLAAYVCGGGSARAFCAPFPKRTQKALVRKALALLEADHKSA